MKLWWISKTITNRVIMAMDEPSVTTTVEVLRRFGNLTKFSIIPKPYSRLVKIHAMYKRLKARKAFERFLETTGESLYTWEFRNIPIPKEDAYRLTIDENLTLQQHEQSSDDEIDVVSPGDLVPPTIDLFNIENPEYENSEERNHQVLSARTGSPEKNYSRDKVSYTRRRIRIPKLTIQPRDNIQVHEADFRSHEQSHRSKRRSQIQSRNELSYGTTPPATRTFLRSSGGGIILS
ncbi:hypothetical protein QAD02_007268 [Eretmocerus hayati]|uniref:Uncharacterized protein n=1 Tax=Eretmocerus hayati TaxID=131215 RepID=A0ACC2N4I9_9HYME|nr:hypothetical protein QAD02_007268 [Eretmocerus hayati]